MQATDRDAPDREAPLLLALGLAFCASMPAGFPGAGALPTGIAANIRGANPALVAALQGDSGGARGFLATAGQRAGDAK